MKNAAQQNAASLQNAASQSGVSRARPVRRPLAATNRPVVQAPQAQASQARVEVLPVERHDTPPPAQNSIARRALQDRAYVAEVGEVSEINPLSQGFLSSINQVKALTVANEKLAIASKRRTLAQSRGYELQDLYAIAEIAYHYLMNGGTSIAVTLYEGLSAVAPNEAYFALGLGLALDHSGDKKGAFAAYTRAGELDPHDARPDVNRAELLLESGDKNRARQLLSRALGKAANRGDAALERKAQAILTHISRA